MKRSTPNAQLRRLKPAATEGGTVTGNREIAADDNGVSSNSAYGRMTCAVGRPAHNDVGGRGRLGQPSLPTTGNGETAKGASSKYAFCETNPPVKERVMNGLGDRGCEFGKGRLGKQLRARWNQRSTPNAQPRKGFGAGCSTLKGRVNEATSRKPRGVCNHGPSRSSTSLRDQHAESNLEP